MAKRRRKKNGGKIYAVLLTIYIIAMFCAAGYGLSIVWAYAEEFEQSQPEPVMDKYVEELNAYQWGDTIARTVSEMDHEMQSDEECAQIIKDLLSGGVSYARGASGGVQGTICYVLRCDQGSFGRVWLEEDTSKKADSRFGMLPWRIAREEFDFTGLYTGIQVTVPESFSVYINGNKLSKDYIVEEGIHYDVLEEYYESYSGLPTKVTYRFENIIGRIEPVIKDSDGNEFTVDSTKDDSQYLRSCGDKELQQLKAFADKFAPRYYDYVAGIYDPTYGYQRIMPYIKLGSDLDERLKLAMDGLYFAHTVAVRVDEVQLNSAVWMADGIYLCDISVTVTTTGPRETEQKQENMKLIVLENGGDYRAVSQELY